MHPDETSPDPRITKKPSKPSRERPSVKPTGDSKRSGVGKREGSLPDSNEVEGEKTVETGETPDDQAI